MTEEQIKQNAEEYAINSGYDPLPKGGWIDCTATDTYEISVDSYIEGANSRDEEIANLLSQLEDKDGYIAHLQEELNKLRNPWISVEERLPEKLKGKYYSKYVFVRYNGFGCRYCVDRYCYLTKTWEFQVDSVTHWMPIPEVNKGE